MGTLDRLKNHAESIMAKGGPSNADEVKVMTIYNSLSSKKAGNAGKRTNKNHNNNW